MVSQWAFYDAYQNFYQQVGSYYNFNISTWGGVCSSTCGGGIRNKYRYVIVPPSYGGAACPNLYTTAACNTNPCPGDCVVSQWTTYDTYSQYLADTVTSSQVVIGVDQFQAACSVSCGVGYRISLRHVITPATNGGKSCPALSKVIQCNSSPCPVDCVVSQWTYYDSYTTYYNAYNVYSYLLPAYTWTGACSKTCGGGVRTAFRYIIVPASNGGQSCPILTETISCNVLPCPVDCVVSQWASYPTYSSYSLVYSNDPNFIALPSSWQGVCTQSCNSGFYQVFRRILVQPKNGGAACPVGPNAYIQTLTCNTFSCPIDCVVSDWVTYSSYSAYQTALTPVGTVLPAAVWGGLCTQSCGGGSQSAFRWVITPSQYGGASCPILNQTVTCNSQACPTDCVVSSWAVFDTYAAYVNAFSPFGAVDSQAAFRGSCSASCGGGTRFLYRRVIIPATNSGSPCPPLYQVVSCNTSPCPVDCVVGQWTAYSNYANYAAALGLQAQDQFSFTGLCTASCGGGSHSIYRTILVPPQYGGQACPLLIQTVSCNNQNCPVNCIVSNWVSYDSYASYLLSVSNVNPIPQASFLGSCSASCGGGVRTVFRSIIQTELYGGTICPILSKTITCNVFPCPADCVVSQWATFDSYSVYQSTLQAYVANLIPPQVWYGTCSATCGTGSRTAFRYIVKYPSNGGQVCPALTKNLACNTKPCPTPCVVSQWSATDPTTGLPSQCTATCGGGSQLWQRSVIVPSGYGGAACPPLTKTGSCNTQNCPVDCVVSQWAAYDDYSQYCTVQAAYGGSCVPQPLWYGQCSKTCGGGVRNVYRYIITPPSYGGATCPSLVTQVGCNVQPCPGDCVVSNWVSYTDYASYKADAIRYGVPYTTPAGFAGQCSASCGTGYQVVYRYIVTPAAYNGKACPGLTEIITCNTQPCPVDCVVSQWAGFTSYSVYASVMAAYGPIDDRSTWRGVCSKSCGGGYQYIYRQITTQPQYGGLVCPALYLQIVCNAHACPVDCVVSSWTDIGAISDTTSSHCSVSCGGGQRAQIRIITQYPSADGSQCPALTRQLVCNTQPCPVDCVVSSWATYNDYATYYSSFGGYPYAVNQSTFNGACSRTCGSGIRYQYRYILQTPLYGGVVCPALIQAVSCNLAPCPGDCGVSTWASYASYSQTELNTIFPGLTDAQYVHLGTCSKSCGGGTQLLFRKILIAPLFGGAVCPNLTQYVSCNTQACPVDCKVTTWAQYDSYADYFKIYHGYPECETLPAWRGQCSNTCGGGVREVYRQIIVAPQNGGVQCPALYKTIVCNTNSCPVDCVLSSWGQFTAVAAQCSRSCGGGTAVISRSVVHYPSFGGAICGSLTKVVTCNTQACPIDCQVSQWSEFDSYTTYYASFFGSYGLVNEANFNGLCTASCGTGQRNVYRKVTVNPQFGGAACPPLIKLIGCNTNSCPIDCIVSSWALYGSNGFVVSSNQTVATSSQCTASCGGGLRTVYRHIITPAGYGGRVCPALSKDELCNNVPCPGDCVVSDWAYYNVYDPQFYTVGQCTATCGGGTRVQYRTILSPTKYGGAACPSLLQTVACNVAACPQDCVVSSWADTGTNGQIQACSVTCGTGTRLQTRYVVTYPQYGGQACGSLSRQIECNTTPCPGDCVVSSWATTGTCTATCGGGVQTYFRKVITPAKNSGNSCPVLTKTVVCNPLPCPIDCQVGSWTDFAAGSCTATCGGGVKQQLRLIIVQASFGGLACPVTIRSLPCNINQCPHDCVVSQWADYTTNNTAACSVTCGGGTKTQIRSIVSNAMYGGASCPILTKTVVCSTQPCSVDCVVSQWVVYDPNSVTVYPAGQPNNHIDSQCSVSCGGGVRLQYRTILVNPQNGGVGCPLLERIIECNVQPCPVDCVVSSWTLFDPKQIGTSNIYYQTNACSVTCGGGTQVLYRTILIPSAYGGLACPPLAQEIVCNTQACPGQCNLTAWQDVNTTAGLCSLSCGGGVKLQSRSVISYPTNGGSTCPGLTQEVACNTAPCPINCAVSSWSNYNRDFDSPYLDFCSATCGGGFLNQFRTVIQYPANGGNGCPALSRTVACNTQACPVDCVVSGWVQYASYNDYFAAFFPTGNYNAINAWGGVCTATCGGGQIRQYRTIITQPANGGAQCPALTQQVTCNAQPCPIDCVVGDWVNTAFPCTLTCGYGTRTQQRYILVQPNYGGAACPPLSREVECATQPCPGDCVVGDWTNYNPVQVHDYYYPFSANCSVSCGGGVQMQVRYIIKYPINGGASCPALTRQISCNTFGCPVNCVVSEWTQFGPNTGLGTCSASCGGGFKTLYRTILVLPQFGGVDCPALTTKVACNQAPCPCPPPPICPVTCPFGFAPDLWGCGTCNCANATTTTQLYQPTTSGINHCISNPCPAGYICANQASNSYPFTCIYNNAYNITNYGSNANSAGSSASSGSSGTIAGAVVGSVVGVALVALIAILVLRRRNSASAKRLSMGSIAEKGSLSSGSGDGISSTTVPEFRNPAYLGVHADAAATVFSPLETQGNASANYLDEGF